MKTQYNYAELLAMEVFKTGSNEKPFNVAYPMMVRDLGAKGAKSMMMYDEDFVGDFLSTLSELKSLGAPEKRSYKKV